MTFNKALAILAALTLGACMQGTAQQVTRLDDPELTHTVADVPKPQFVEGQCWGRDISPALIETVTEQVVVQKEKIGDDGKIITPATYRTETHQRIVRERAEVWFRTPCDQELDFEFVSNLQRALQARKLYQGPINGILDEETDAAIRKFQTPRGLDSKVLSLAAARQLGLIAIERPRS